MIHVLDVVLIAPRAGDSLRLVVINTPFFDSFQREKSALDKICKPDRGKTDNTDNI